MTSFMEKEKTSPTLSQVVSSQEGVIHNVSLGYAAQLPRNRSMLSVLAMSLAIAAVPYGIGGPLISSIYGGGQLSMFLGVIVSVVLNCCVAVSLSELASRYPTSSGVYYWSYRLSEDSSYRKSLSFLTGWLWLIGNWTITLSVNFGFASLLAATISIYDPDFTATTWQLLLIFYALLVVTFFICGFGDRLLPYVDMVAAVFNALTILVVLLAVSTTAKAGRHSPAYALGHYDTSLSGWNSFSFFIGLLPPAYCFCAIGMITSMAEECHEPEIEVPRAISLSVPVGGVAALFFVLPLCFTLPPLEDILSAPYGQALPYILITVMGSKPGAVIVMVLLLIVTLLCSISITTAASRCTWAFSRDKAVPGWRMWCRTDWGRPLLALCLVTAVQMLLGLIYLGSTSAFTAFVSVGVIGLAMGYLVPISISLASGRQQVCEARWKMGKGLGAAANLVAVLWILFELVLFSMPTVLPVTPASMNYASVVLVGFALVSGVYYVVSRDGKSAAESGRFYGSGILNRIAEFKGPPPEELVS